MTENLLGRYGTPSQEDLARVAPCLERRAKGPVVMIECFQPIPCDPCYHSCRFGAIKEFADINDLPSVDFDKCIGCGLCVAACPGLAIFVIDESVGEDECLVALPHEFSPLPSKGDAVELADREGNTVGVGRAERVIPGVKPAGTPVCWVRMPKSLSLTVRSIRYPITEG